MTDVPTLNRILHAIRNGTAWNLPDADLAIITGEDWPCPPPNSHERWMKVYCPEVSGVTDWTTITNSIRARRKPVAAPVVAAAQPISDPEADAILAQLQRESDEADAHVRMLEAAASKPSPIAPAKRVTPPVVTPEPPMPPRAEQAVTANGRRWNVVVNELVSLGSGGKLPTKRTFEKFIERNALDKLE